MDDHIRQIAIVMAQMAAMLTLANGIPIPSKMQLLGMDIPHLEVSCQNDHPTGN